MDEHHHTELSVDAVAAKHGAILVAALAHDGNTAANVGAHIERTTAILLRNNTLESRKSDQR